MESRRGRPRLSLPEADFLVAISFHYSAYLLPLLALSPFLAPITGNGFPSDCQHRIFEKVKNKLSMSQRCIYLTEGTKITGGSRKMTEKELRG